MKSPRHYPHHRPSITEVRIAILVGAGLVAIVIAVTLLIPLYASSHQ